MNRTKIIVLVAFTLLLNFTEIINAQTKTVAVIDFVPSSEYDSDMEGIAKTANDTITTFIVNYGKNEINVVERMQIDKVLKEQGFQQSGFVDIDTAVELGKLVGANYVIVGSVNSTGGFNVRINAKIVDVETAKIIYSEFIDASDENAPEQLNKLAYWITEDLIPSLKYSTTSSSSNTITSSSSNTILDNIFPSCTGADIYNVFARLSSITETNNFSLNTNKDYLGYEYGYHCAYLKKHTSSKDTSVKFLFPSSKIVNGSKWYAQANFLFFGKEFGKENKSFSLNWGPTLIMGEFNELTTSEWYPYDTKMEAKGKFILSHTLKLTIQINNTYEFFIGETFKINYKDYKYGGTFLGIGYKIE